jgi:MscS family membrane protein
LALQEPLGNIFSGLSLLIEAPFKKGDLVLLSDGRISEVLHLGIRSTMMFSLEDQATIYLPNKMLASTILINMTKPTPEQRYMIDVNLGQPCDLAEIQMALVHIAEGHPAILSSRMSEKYEHVKTQIETIRRRARRMPEGSPAAAALLEEADKNERTLARLELEGQWNAQILTLKESLRNLIRGINAREVHGLSEGERQELYCNFVSPTDNNIQVTMAMSKNWFEARDAWLNDTDFWNQRKVWERRNEQLQLHWERLKKVLYQVDERDEMRLDDNTKQMLEWMEREYKVPPGYWKDPSIVVKELSNGNIGLKLCYYVDNIRLEHDHRPQRVRAEVSRLIHEELVERGLWK